MTGSATGGPSSAQQGTGRKPTDEWAFLLPPGWARFPTGPDRKDELDDAIEHVVARALPDQSPDQNLDRAAELRDSLRATFVGAGDAESTAGAGPGVVYLPTEPVAGMAVPASITETEILADRRLDPVEVAADVLGAGYAVSGPVDLDGRPGARLTNTVHDVHREGDRPPVSTRRVVYVVSRDEADGDWLLLTFSTSWSSRGTERLAETLVEFFDAVMATFRWRGPGSDPVHLPERRVPGSA